MLSEKNKSAVANKQFTNNPISIALSTSGFGSVIGIETYGMSIALQPEATRNKRKIIKIKLLSWTNSA